MKKLTAIFLCVFTLTVLSGCRAEAAASGAPHEMTDEMIEQMAESYLNMDIDGTIEIMREAGAPMDEATVEMMRDMQKAARDGTLVEYLRGSAAAEQEEEADEPPIGEWLYNFTGGVPYLSAMKLGVPEIDNPPDTQKALSIAKKYYDMCVSKVDFGLGGLVDWTPDFTGKVIDPGKAVALSPAAALSQRLTDAAYHYTALNAAVFALDPGGAAGAINLATAIATAGEDLEAMGGVNTAMQKAAMVELGPGMAANVTSLATATFTTDKDFEARAAEGVNKSDFYRDALSMYCHALIVAEPDEGEHVITALTSVGALFWDMGNITAAERVLAAVVEMDPYCCEAFDLLYNLYVSTKRLNKAWTLRLKSPTRLMYLTVQKAREADEQTLKDVDVRGYTQVYNESDMETLAEVIDNMSLSTLADYYENFDRAGAADVRRHAQSKKDMMRGLMPPDIAKDPMFSSYDAFFLNGAGFGEAAVKWSKKSSQVYEKRESLFPAYLEKVSNLAKLRDMENDYFNPNDIELQMENIGLTNLLIGYFSPIKDPMQIRRDSTFLEMTLLARKNYEEIAKRQFPESHALFLEHYSHSAPGMSEVCCTPAEERLNARHHNEMNDHYTGVFANALNLAVPVYESFRNAAYKAHPAVMARIMMITDEDVQQYYLALWEDVLTSTTVYALDMLNSAVGTCDYNYAPRRAVATEMLDPQSALRQASRPSNEDIMKQRQAYLDFYSGKIDENSQFYKKMDEKYGVEMDFVVFKFRINDFITRTMTKIDLGAASGQLGTTTNRMTNATAYDGTVKFGVSRKVGDASVSAGASGSLKMTIDGHGDLVPNSVEWKAGVEAGIKGGPLKVGGGFGYGTEGEYATLRAELSKFGGSIGGGVEATTTKGTKLSGSVSISNSPVKDAAGRLAGESDAGKAAAGSFGGMHDNYMNKKKTLWTGEYVIPD